MGMSSEPPPPAPPAPATPVAAADAPALEPLTRRRIVLLALVGVLVVALVAGTLTLRAAIDAIVPSESAGRTDSVAIDLPDCRGEFGPWVETLIEQESPRIVQVYGQSPVTATAYRHPEGFPTVAFAWSSVQPTCGTTLVLPDGTGVAYYVDAADSSRAQFDAVSSLLTALGYVMTADDSDRELLEIEETADEPVAPEADESAPDGPVAGEEEASNGSAYHYFRLPDGRRLWIQFDPFDGLDPDGAGDLYFGYFPAA